MSAPLCRCDTYGNFGMKNTCSQAADLKNQLAQMRRQIATLTRQRDLAVEALESCGVNDGMNGQTQYYDEKLVETALSTIKGGESSVKAD